MISDVKTPPRVYKEELINAITHGLGVVLSIIGFAILLHTAIMSGSSLLIVCSSVYGSSLVILYLMSTFYHASRHPVLKKVLQKLDHMSIYLLIAGSYMPLTLIVLKGTLGWSLFGIEWGLCLLGIMFKAFFGPRFGIVSGLFYLFMSWLLIFALKPLLLAFPFQGVSWLFWGGAFYTFGMLFFAVDKAFRYFHAIWHLFVLGGSACHFIMILLYVIPCSILPQ